MCVRNNIIKAFSWLSVINKNMSTIHGFNCNSAIKTLKRSLNTDSHDIKPVSMAFITYGNDQPIKDQVPVIVMHGLFGSKTNWYSLGKVITKETQKKVHLVDARNHGDSPHTDEHSYFHLAEDIKHFMSENGIEKADLIGHSMGGRAMMAFALLYPQKIRSLSVVDISPIGTPESMSDGMRVIFDAMEAIKQFTSKSLSTARKAVESQLNSALDSKELSSFLSMNLGDVGNGQYSWKINLKSLTKNYHPHLTVFPIKEGEFNGPTIFICGEQSDFVNFKDVDKIKKLFPTATFVKIPNAGHWLHAEQPRKFLDVVCNFINSAKS